MINNNQMSFSVAMCVYGKDNPVWFRQAIDSLLNQTVKPSEIVLVVDGLVPLELDEEIVRCEQMECFRVIRLPRNVGHGNARRESLAHCRYELVALMDADDISLPDRFEKQLAVFDKNPHLTIVGGNIAEFVKDESDIVGYRIVPERHEDIIRYMKKRCPFNQVTVMFKKSDIDAVGGYIDWHCNEDYYLWVRLFLANKCFANIKDTLVNVRVDVNTYKRRGGWKYFISEARLQKFMRKKGVIRGTTYFTNVVKRLVVQMLMPNGLRSWVFQKFARKKNNR